MGSVKFHRSEGEHYRQFFFAFCFAPGKYQSSAREELTVLLRILLKNKKRCTKLVSEGQQKGQAAATAAESTGPGEGHSRCEDGGAGGEENPPEEEGGRNGGGRGRRGGDFRVTGAGAREMVDRSRETGGSGSGEMAMQIIPIPGVVAACLAIVCVCVCVCGCSFMRAI